jgi:hypothetical protein
MADDTNKLFSFQGYVFLGETGGSKPVNPVWVGDATLTVALETETADHYESFSGQRMLYGQLATRKTANATLTLFEARAENFSLGLYGGVVDEASGTATAEAFPSGLVAGDTVALDHGFPSSLVLTDSTASPVTLVEGQHYEIYPLGSNQVRLLDVASLTQPINAAYSYGKLQRVTMFTATPPERFLILHGVNTLNGKKVRVELPRVKFNPASEINLHHEEFGQFELSGAVLYSPVTANNPEMGGFWRIILED